MIVPRQLLDWYQKGVLHEQWQLIHQQVVDDQPTHASTVFRILDCAIFLNDQAVLIKGLDLLAKGAVSSRPLFVYAKRNLAIDRIDTLFQIYLNRFAGNPHVARFVGALIAASDLLGECCDHLVALRNTLPDDAALAVMTAKSLVLAKRDKDAQLILEDLRARDQLGKSGAALLNQIGRRKAEQAGAILSGYADGTLPDHWQLVRELAAHEKPLDPRIVYRVADCALLLNDETVLVKALELISEGNARGGPLFDYAKRNLAVDQIDRLFRVYSSHYSCNPHVAKFVAAFVATAVRTARSLESAKRGTEALPILEDLHARNQLGKSASALLNRIRRRQKAEQTAAILSGYADGTLPDHWQLVRELVAHEKPLDPRIVYRVADCALLLNDETVLVKGLELISQGKVSGGPLFDYAKRNLGIDRIDRLFALYTNRFAGNPHVARHVASLIMASTLSRRCCDHLLALQKVLPGDPGIAAATVTSLSLAGRETEALPIVEVAMNLQPRRATGRRKRPAAPDQAQFPGASEPHKIAFIHIRKTAGTTFLEAVGQNYRPEQQLSLDGRPQNIAKALYSLMNLGNTPVSFVYGHVGFGITKYLAPAFKTITILRNPIERSISQYFFLQDRTEAGPSYFQDHSLAYAIEDPEVNHLFTNVQTRALSSETVQISDKPASEMNDGDLKNALQNLKLLYMFGFTEEFATMMEQLTRSTGLRLHSTPRNVNPKKPAWKDLSSQEQSLLARANELDLELYQAARKMRA